MKAVPLSQMRDRVTIQSRTQTRDTRGGTVDTWAEVAEVWARVEPLSGREFWQAQQAQAQTTHKVTIRYYDGLTSTHRLLYGSRVLNIDSVIDVESRKREHQLLCKEEV